MAYAAAALPHVTAFDGREFARGDCRRAFLGSVSVTLGAVAAVGLMAGTVTAAAAWIIGAAFAVNPDLRAHPPPGLEVSALIAPYRSLAAAGDFFGMARVSTHSAYAPHLSLDTRLASATAASLASAAPSRLALEEIAEPLRKTSLPQPRSSDVLQIENNGETARSSPDRIVPQIAIAAAAFPVGAFSLFQKNLMPAPAESHSFVVAGFTPNAQASGQVTAAGGGEQRAGDRAGALGGKTASLGPGLAQHHRPVSQPGPDSRTAIYDIAAHTVYLPDGERLEAHSGLGYRRDDPRYVHERGRGPTPPNVYHLVLREGLFHRVRAIRLNPVGDGKMFGRGGILAHTYMLGPSGQSFGCVSFRNYPRFLRAFLGGEVDRMVVVPHLDTSPSDFLRAYREKRVGRYAFNNPKSGSWRTSLRGSL